MKEEEQKRSIPFNRATVAANQLAYVEQAVTSDRLSGDGPFGRKAEKILELLVGGGRALLTTSCTHALEMAALLLDLKPGDEVIVPAFTFVSTANAFALRGARIVFCDVRPDTLNLDEKLLPSLITERTRAIVVVHYAGVGCEMDAILSLGSANRIAVIEDNAHGLFGTYNGRALGSFGVLATQSFHETKNISCGEGGALIVNNPSYVARAEILREKGTNRSAFFRGQVDKYTWVDLGSSWVLSDILGAMLFAQLEERVAIQARRKAIWQRYTTGLSDWAKERGVRMPIVPAKCESAFHMFQLVFPSLERRTSFIDYLARDGHAAVFHYQALNRSPMAAQLNAEMSCPVTEEAADCLARLPFFTDLAEDDQDRVITSARSWM